MRARRAARRLVNIFLEFIGGLLLGVLAGMVAREVAQGQDELITGIINISAYVLGISAGVSMVGLVVGEDGSFILAFLAAVIGAIVVEALAGVTLTGTSSFVELVQAALTSIWVIGPVLATLGYNLSAAALRFQQ
jgi:uncharacterized membrane protein YeaQ/YmgE (transglycosylase-associated protein family)